MSLKKTSKRPLPKPKTQRMIEPAPPPLANAEKTPTAESPAPATTSPSVEMVSAPEVQTVAPVPVVVFVDKTLLGRIENALRSAMTAGDYTYATVTDVVREALVLLQKEPLPGIAPFKVERRPFSLRVPPDLKAVWDKLPNKIRNALLENRIKVVLDRWGTG